MNKFKKHIYRGCVVLSLGSAIISGEYFYKYNNTFECNEKILYANKTNNILVDDYSNHEKKGTLVNGENILNTREEVSIDSSMDSILVNGETVNIVDEKEEWYEIEENDDVMEYIKPDYIEEHNHNKEYQQVTLNIKNVIKEEKISQEYEQDLTNISKSEENSKKNQIKKPSKIHRWPRDV